MTPDAVVPPMSLQDQIESLVGGVMAPGVTAAPATTDYLKNSPDALDRTKTAVAIFDGSTASQRADFASAHGVNPRSAVWAPATMLAFCTEFGVEPFWVDGHVTPPAEPAAPEEVGLVAAIRAAVGKPMTAHEVGVILDDRLSKFKTGTDKDEVLKIVQTALAKAMTEDMRGVRMAAVKAAARSGNVILDKLLQFYPKPGVETMANVCLTAPPSIGKSFAARQMGSAYDRYFEHPCSDDIDEVATLRGTPTPDGSGGFVIVDGVLVEAVRAAAAGQTCLVLFDEIFRLPSRAQEWMLTFLTGVKRPGGRVYQIRTCRATPSGFEVIECPAKNLHIMAAANLGLTTPVEAFWDRFETVRITFDLKTATSVAKSLADSYGIADSDALSKTFANVVSESRKMAAQGSIRYPVSFRVLERGCALAPKADAATVAKYIASRIEDNVAGWDCDTGDVPSDSRTAAKTLAGLMVAK